MSLHPLAGPKAPGQVSLSASDVSDLAKSSVCSGSESENMRSVKPESGWNARGNWDNSGAIYGGCRLIPQKLWDLQIYVLETLASRSCRNSCDAESETEELDIL